LTPKGDLHLSLRQGGIFLYASILLLYFAAPELSVTPDPQKERKAKDLMEDESKGGVSLRIPS
jgi:hypothetical protein